MTCGKMVFMTRGDAEQYVRAVGRKNRNKGVLNAYQCKDCGNFHLSSWSPAKRRHVARVILSINRKRRASNENQDPST